MKSNHEDHEEHTDKNRINDQGGGSIREKDGPPSRF